MTLDNPNLGRLRALLPDASRRRLAIMEAVRDTFIDIAGVEEIKSRLTKVIESLQPRADNSRGQAEGLLISAAAGAGKSRCLKEVMREMGLSGDSHPVFFAFEIQAPTTLKEIAREILDRLGEPYPMKSSGAERWSLVREAFEARGICMLVLDEFQDLAKFRSEEDKKEILNAVKGLTAPGPWPIAPILVGTEAAASFVNKDFQVVRREAFVTIPRLDPAADRAWLVRAIDDLAMVAGMVSRITMMDDLAPRLMHAANLARGLALEWTVKAIDVALEDGAVALDIGHFARAWALRRDARRAEDNPFLASDWRAIDCGVIVAEAT